jgi:hypothetical protein
MAFGNAIVEYHAPRRAETDDVATLRRYGILSEQKKRLEAEMETLREDVASIISKEDGPIDIGDYTFEITLRRTYDDRRLDIEQVLYVGGHQIPVTEREIKQALKDISGLNKRKEFEGPSTFAITARRK